MAESTPPLKVILRAAGLALAIGLSVAFVLAPTSSSPVVRAIELIAVIALGILALAAVLALVTGWLAGWQDGEAEFELVVRRAERLAGDNLAEATRLLGEMSDRAKIDKRRDDEDKETLNGILADVRAIIAAEKPVRAAQAIFFDTRLDQDYLAQRPEGRVEDGQQLIDRKARLYAELAKLTEKQP